jgi:ribosomal protein S18 acetylase RimI-like enzyme
MIRWGQERARAGAWRADGTVAFLVPLPDGRAPSVGGPSAEFVRHCLRALAERGFKRVITGALGPEEQQGFIEAGFDVYEELHLLVLDRDTRLPPAPPEPRLHRAWAGRKTGLLRVDAQAFKPFWRLDRAGLKEAVKATPRRRLRVILGEDGAVAGYAISGAAGMKGFVQRLAVLPESQGRGLGTRLLVDGLDWLRREGTYEVAVNTQKGNSAALALYHKVGFRDDPSGLCVLSADIAQVNLSKVS